MFRYFILIPAIVLYLSANAQGGWKRKYFLPNSSTSQAVNVFEVPAGNYIITGLTYETVNGDQSYKLTLVGTDSQGNTQWTKKYGRSTFTYLDAFTQNSFVHDNNFFYVTTCVRDSNNKQIGVLLKFDFNGDTLWQKIYRNPDPQEDVIPIGLTRSIDGGFLITGFFQHWGNHTNLCLLIKTDKNGNELWRKKISKAVPNVQMGYDIVQDTSTKKIIIVGYQYIGSSTYQESFSNILILDSVGNKKIQTTFNNGDGGGFPKVIQLKDKNFLTSGSINANSDLGIHSRCNSTIVKFDIDANIIWQKTYDTLSLYNTIHLLSEHPSGDIFAAGVLDTVQNYNLLEVVKVKMFRLDKNGNVIWRKYIGSSYGNINSEGVRSMRTTIDKGFIFSTGFPYLTDPKPYSIIKVDSTGCDTSEQWCRSVALNVSKFQSIRGWEFELFPNPASDFLSVSVNAPSGKEFSLKIIDVSGKEAGSFTYSSGTRLAIDTRHYPEGVYFATLYHEGKAIETRKLVIVH